MADATVTFAVHRAHQLLGRHTFRRDIIKIGNDPKSHLQLDDPLAARMHAVVEISDCDRITLIDLGNEPGSVVNGSRVAKCRLRPGDEIRIGSTTIVLEDAVSASASVPAAVAKPPPAPVRPAPPRADAAFGTVVNPVNPFAAGAALSEEQARRAALRVPEEAPAETYTYSLIKSGPDVPVREVELAGVRSVEVMVLWGNSVLQVQHLTPPRSYYVGEEDARDRACDFFLPAEVLGTTRLPIVVSDGVQVSVVLPPGATGRIELPGSAPQSVEQARQHAAPSPEVSGGHLLELAPGTKARIAVGQFVFQLAAVDAGKPAPAGLGASRDYSVASYFGMSLLAHAGLIAALAFFVPPLGLTEDETADQQRLHLIQAYLGAQAEREQQARPPTEGAAQHPTKQEGGTGTRAAGEEGQMGKPTAPQRDARYGVKGPRDNRQTVIARAEALREARDFGMIGLLNIVSGDPNAPVAPWGEAKALGSDEVSKQGHMWGSTLDDAWGYGGLGLSGIGEGGGGRGEGIGLGDLGGLGHGAGTGTGQGFGPGGSGLSHGRLAPTHQTRVPRVRPGNTVVSGRLPPEVIQRIVRQNYGRFRMCYERGLQHNPNLEGRVAVRFVIGSDGTVNHAANGGSDLPSGEVVSCVVRAYYGLSFPQPEGGIVTVVYPIMFSPG